MDCETKQVELFLKNKIAYYKNFIPFKLYIQKSHVIKYKNKTYFPKIFISKIEYYNYIIKNLRLIKKYFKSQKGKYLINLLNTKNVTLRIILTHSNFTIMMITKK